MIGGVTVMRKSKSAEFHPGVIESCIFILVNSTEDRNNILYIQERDIIH